MKDNSTDTKAVSLTLHIDVGQDTDVEELDRLTHQLLAELQELDIESVELIRDKAAPDGTKSAEAVTLGVLAVAVLPAVVPKLIEFLQAWSMRREGHIVKVKTQIGERSVEVEYSPKTMSPAELKSLVDMLAGTLVKKK